jgi:hypothetical protein
MNYDVTWPAPIRQRLLDFYALTAQGTGRETAELNDALTKVEVALQRTPTAAGESRNGDRRVIIVSPIFRGIRGRRRNSSRHRYPGPLLPRQAALTHFTFRPARISRHNPFHRPPIVGAWHPCSNPVNICPSGPSGSPAGS